MTRSPEKQRSLKESSKKAAEGKRDLSTIKKGKEMDG